MIKNIEDIIGIDDKGNKSVIGKVLYESENDYSKYKCFYIGWNFDLEDILFKEVNSRNIGVKDLTAFRREYAEKNATGVIYFPQINKYRFKTANDEVVYWACGMTDEEVDKALNEEITKYEDKKKAVINRVYEIIDMADDDDPLLELYDIPTLSRKTNCSRR